MRRCARARAFRAPIAYDAIRLEDFDALLLPGGHAKGMRPYLESAVLQAHVASFFEVAKPVGAICHGVLLAARSQHAVGQVGVARAQDDGPDAGDGDDGVADDARFISAIITGPIR